jgi:hypothetical protein
MLVYPGVAMEYHVMLGAHLLDCQMSPKQVWNWLLEVQEPSYFLGVTWCGEALYGFMVQGVEVLLLLGGLFLPCVAPASKQDF